ncbi:MAG TPA: hypothetical protein VFU98_18825, partial [Microlunatus sp.]|nr:hypothetical protein [Microlunatus sp.]
RVWTPVPVLGVASCLLLLTQQSGIVWVYALGLLGLGALLFLLGRRGRRTSTIAAGPSPTDPRPERRDSA